MALFYYTAKMVNKELIYINLLICRGSAVAPGDVILGLLVFGAGKNAAGGPGLDDFTHMEEAGLRRHACRLLHGMGHNHDRKVVF